MRRKDEQSKRLEGTWRADRARPAAVGEGKPRAPRGFVRQDPAAARWWRELVAVLPWLGAADGPALLLLCRHMARADEAALAMARDGLKKIDRVHGGMESQSPAALVWSRESAAAARLLKELGATVTSRGARPVLPDEGEKDLAGFLFEMVTKEK